MNGRRKNRNETPVYKQTRVFPLEVISEVRGGDTSWGKYTEEKRLKNVYAKTKPNVTPNQKVNPKF